MSGTDEITASIEDYLLSLADSLQDAQQLLSQRQIASLPGQPALAYQLPKLEFELKIALNVEKKSANIVGDRLYLPIGATPDVLPPITDKKLVSQPGGAALHEHNVSTIKGAFVAVPVKGARPNYVTDLIKTESLRGGSAYLMTFKVTVQDRNQAATDLRIEANIEKERLLEFNGDLVNRVASDRGADIQSAVSILSEWFTISDAIVETDELGEANFEVSLEVEKVRSLYTGTLTLPLFILVGGTGQHFLLPFEIS